MRYGRLRGLALLLFVSPCTAGTAALEPPDLERYLRWGFLRARPGIEVRDVGYDDNILLSDERKISDYRATLSPRLEGVVLFGDRAFLRFRERVDYTVYAENDDQNFFNQRGNGRFTVPFSRSGVFVDFALNRVKERPVEQEDIRRTRREGVAGGGVVLNAGWRTEIELSRTFHSFRHSDPDEVASGSPGSLTVSERLDRSDVRDRLFLTYRATSATHFTMELHDTTLDFERDPTSIDRDSRERSGWLGIELTGSSALSGQARIGWSSIDADDPARPDFSEAVGDFRLDYRPDSQLRVRLDGKRDSGFSIYEDTTYFVDTRLGMGLIYYLRPSLGLEAGTLIGTLDFPADRELRKDDFTRYELGVRMRMRANSLGRQLVYQVKFGRERRDSTRDSLDRTRNLFSAGAVVGF